MHNSNNSSNDVSILNESINSSSLNSQNGAYYSSKAQYTHIYENIDENKLDDMKCVNENFKSNNDYHEHDTINNIDVTILNCSSEINEITSENNIEANSQTKNDNRNKKLIQNLNEHAL